MSRLTYTAIGIPFFLSLAVLAQTGMPPGLAKTHAEFESATTKGDKATVQRLMTDDATWVNRAGRLRDKKTVVQEIEPSTGKSSPPNDVRAYPGGAIVLFTRQATDAANAPTIRVLQVWVQQGGAWKLAAHQGVPADPKEKVPPATAASSPLPANAGSASDLKAIDEAIAALNAGNQKGDAKNFAASVTDQFVVVSSTRIGSKQDRINDLSSGKPQPGGLTVEQRSTRVYGDIAVVNHSARIQSGGRLQQTIVYVRQGGKWLRAGIINTPVATS